MAVENFKIPVYKTIAELHAANGVTIPNPLPDFHVFPLEETYPDAVDFMPPYKKLFYQIVFFLKGKDVRVSLNTQSVQNPENLMYFNGVGHTYSYKRGPAQKGFIIYFSEAFINPLHQNVQADFPFFKITELNVLHLKDEEVKLFKTLFQIMVQEYRKENVYLEQLMRSMLSSILWKIKSIYEVGNKYKAAFSRFEYIAERFQQLVNNFYLEHKTVEHYANLLNISAGHLSDIITNVMGTSPKAIIQQRLLSEAKNLLNYTDLSVSEITYRLGFADPTSFGKFFRKYENCTPVEFRRNRKNADSIR